MKTLFAVGLIATILAAGPARSAVTLPDSNPNVIYGYSHNDSALGPSFSGIRADGALVAFAWPALLGDGLVTRETYDMAKECTQRGTWPQDGHSWVIVLTEEPAGLPVGPCVRGGRLVSSCEGRTRRIGRTPLPRGPIVSAACIEIPGFMAEVWAPAFPGRLPSFSTLPRSQRGPRP